MIEGPGHVPMQLHQGTLTNPVEGEVHEAPFLQRWAVDHATRAGYETTDLPSAIGAAQYLLVRTAMRCYVRTPKEHRGLAEQDDVQTHHCLQIARMRARPSPRAPPPESISATTRLSKARFRIPLGRPVQPRPSIRTPPRTSMTRRLPKDSMKVAHFCSMCGAAFPAP